MYQITSKLCYLVNTEWAGEKRIERYTKVIYYYWVSENAGIKTRKECRLNDLKGKSSISHNVPSRVSLLTLGGGAGGGGGGGWRRKTIEKQINEPKRQKLDRHVEVLSTGEKHAKLYLTTPILKQQQPLKNMFCPSRLLLSNWYDKCKLKIGDLVLKCSTDFQDPNT